MKIKKAYVDTREGQIHYRHVTLPDRPTLPVVYLHKSASSSQMFEALMLNLADRYNGYALDNPGFGNSYDPESAPDVAYYVNVLLEAIDAIGLSRFHLVGHHTGACFAVQMAAQFAPRVASLTMMGPALLSADEREAFRKHYSTPFNQPVTDGAHLLLTWDYLKRMGVGSSLRLHQREFLDHCRAWQGRCQAYKTVWDQDFQGLFMQVQCPMLVTCAEDDVLWPFFQRARQLRPHISSAVTRGANFAPDIDSVANARALAAFFRDRPCN
jgi:pimeloyl-ACP methyl ester carboxylesterase